ncbi:MAG: nitroreductase [Solobacterium sp.]|nr:nitroreductase [Solobacterium sp.]
MDIKEVMKQRHSVRSYTDEPIKAETRVQLDRFVLQCNTESGLNISVQYDDPDGFDSRLAHYGNFRNVRNYIVLAGKKTADFDFRCGYYGEKIVLYAQSLGLNTCWAALTFNKKNVKKILRTGDSLCMVIALGYGESAGVPHKGRQAVDLIQGDVPDWFTEGVEAALLAPTAMNQQKFEFLLQDGEPAVQVKGIGPYTRVDLGIVAYHFEAVTGRKVRVL